MSWRAVLLPVFLSFVQNVAAGDPDRGMKRTLGIEEAWVENAVYLSTVRDNNANQGHSWNFGIEWDNVISGDWGSEIDAPGILAQQPLGRAPSSLAPVTAGLKYAPISWGDDDSEESGVIGFELEGSWWASPQPVNFPGVGSSVAEQVLVATRRGRYSFQGAYGVSQRAGADARSGWFASNAIGAKISEEWVIQMEVDFNRTSVDSFGNTAVARIVTPQVGWQINPAWQLVMGESFSRVGALNSVMTNLLLEYSYDADEK